MRKKIVAGNWKMNCTLEESRNLTSEAVNMIQDEVRGNAEVILIPTAIAIPEVIHLSKATRVKVGAQNCHQEVSGAYTGEISATILRSFGVEYVLVGHSERRQYFGENNALLAKKTDAVLAEGLTPIYCFGETLDEREAGRHFEVNETQIREGLFHLNADQIRQVVIAYEPVWAIGTGKTASSEQAQEIHAAIREVIASHYGREIAEGISILYGGSVKPSNAVELFGMPDIDGGLIGGAALKSRDFTDIVKALPV